LIDDAVSQAAKIGDLFPQGFNHEDIAWGSSGFWREAHRITRVFQCLLGNGDQLAVFGDLLVFALGSRHALQLIHAALGRARSLGIARQLVGGTSWRNCFSKRVSTRTVSQSKLGIHWG
jgi:hypothetical protein